MFPTQRPSGLPAHETAAVSRSDEGATAELIDELAERMRDAGCPARDAARFAEIAVAHLAGSPDGPEHAAIDDTDESAVMVRVESVIREILRGIARADKPKLEARVHLIARGDAEGAESMRALARDYGYSPEAISKRVDAVRTAFALPPSQFNRAPQSAAIYRLFNRTRINGVTLTTLKASRK